MLIRYEFCLQQTIWIGIVDGVQTGGTYYAGAGMVRAVAGVTAVALTAGFVAGLVGICQRSRGRRAALKGLLLTLLVAAASTATFCMFRLYY